MKETTLGANQWLSDSERLIFDASSDTLHSLVKAKKLNTVELEKRRIYEDSESEAPNNVKRDTITDDLDNLKISLSPMQIRTFVVEIKEI